MRRLPGSKVLLLLVLAFSLVPSGATGIVRATEAAPPAARTAPAAGPAVNVVIAGVLYLWLASQSLLEPIAGLSISEGSFLERVMLVNVSLVLFNLLPAFPMDGGRVVRALLAMRMEYTRATQIVATLGQGMALIFGFIGLFSNPFLLFIAFFVWIGASQEASMVQMKNSVSGIPVTRAMLTDFKTLSPRDNMSQVVALILSGSQHDFPVVDGTGRVAGILERDAFMRALTQHGQSAPVMDFIRRDLPEVDSYEMLELALMRLPRNLARKPCRLRMADNSLASSPPRFSNGSTASTRCETFSGTGSTSSVTGSGATARHD